MRLGAIGNMVVEVGIDAWHRASVGQWRRSALRHGSKGPIRRIWHVGFLAIVSGTVAIERHWRHWRGHAHVTSLAQHGHVGTIAGVGEGGKLRFGSHRHAGTFVERRQRRLHHEASTSV